MSVYLSVVIPVYGCHTTLIELNSRLTQTLGRITEDYEIILVNDSSPDRTWEIILNMAARDSRIKGLNLSRNFGQHYAITAGLNYAKGDWCIVMDCDLQDQPEEILKLHMKAMEGFDIVAGKRVDRKDNLFKRLISRFFYIVLGYMMDSMHDHSVANFGIYKKAVIDAVIRMNDSIRYFPVMIGWVGFKYASIEVAHSPRLNSGSSYTMKTRLKLSLDIILSFSDKPLRLIVRLGILLSSTGMFFAIYYLVKYLKGDISVTGWTSLMVSIWFLSGMIIFVLGFVGLYVGRIFEKVKNRPLYIIAEKINLSE